METGIGWTRSLDDARPTDSFYRAQFTAFIADGGFPCVGAKAAFNAESYLLAVFDKLASRESSQALARELKTFLDSDMRLTSEFATFVAIFREPLSIDEKEFEQLLWGQLQQLHDIDSDAHSWDPTVSLDPRDPRFSFSFGGHALYVVGMHGSSSRLSRRFSWPALIFNLHEQFERLRRDGKWERMRRTIRDQDKKLQGSTNPMLADFGETSEARQYSGRAVENEWRPPFNADGKRVSRCPFGG